MDVLDDLIHAARAHDAVVELTIMSAPWAVTYADPDRLTVLTVVSGSASVCAGDGRPVRLTIGDTAIVTARDGFTIADDPDQASQAIVNTQGNCRSADGEDLTAVMRLGTRSCGGNADGQDVLLRGTYEMAGQVGGRLLAALPPVAVIPAAAGDSTLDLAVAELARDAPGQQVVVDRLLDLLLVTTLRAWFTRPGSGSPRWYHALSDPVVGQAMRLLQEEPAHPWSVEELAKRVGMSRAGLARRFRERVGEAPMSYLAGWRMGLAADLLHTTDDTLAAIARKVGYANAYVLSEAFKRHYGMAPSRYRTRERELT